MAFCSACGAKLNPKEKFCHECGHEVEGENPEKSDQPIPVSNHPVSSRGDSTVGPSEPAPSRPLGSPIPEAPPLPASQTAPESKGGFTISSGCLKIGLIAGGACALLVLLLVILIVSMTSGPADAAKAHIASLRAGNVEEAYSQTSAGFRANTTLDQFRVFVGMYPMLQQGAKINISSRSVENATSSLKGTITSPEGGVFPIEIQLVKEGGEWRILGLDFTAVPAVRSGEASQTEEPAPVEATSGGQSPAQPVNESSVGQIVVGMGRNADGSIIEAGKPFSTNAEALAADIFLINHPAGEKVEIWVEHPETGFKTEVSIADVQGEGSGNLTYDLELPEGGGMPLGEWKVFVRLAGKKMFEQAFQVE